MFVFGDVFHPLKMNHDEDCVEKMVGHIEEDANRLHATFWHQSITELTNVLRREHEAAEKCHICFKDFDVPKNRKGRYRSLHGFVSRSSRQQLQPEILNIRQQSHCSPKPK